jgi:putative ABC transport system permease protein
MPDWARHVRPRLSSLRLSPAREHEIVEELSQHLEDRWLELVAGGASEDGATRVTLAEFTVGDRLAQYMAPLQQARAPIPITPGVATGRVLGDLWMDLRYATRMLRKQPAFTVAAVLALAMGIGATTAIFSVVYSVLIKPLPYPHADELVRIRHRDVDGERSFSETMYLTYREENRTLASIGLWHETAATLTDGGEPQHVRALRVTDGALQALSVQPMRGRWFTTQEYGPSAGGPEPVILSYGFWQRRFGGNDAALGSKFSMEAPSGSRARPLAGQWQVVGIMPRSFRFLDMTPQPDVIVAMRLDPARETINSFSYDALARLAPGVTAAAARVDLERMLPIWLDAWPIQPGGSTKEAIANWRITPVVRALKDDLVGGVARTLWVLMGAIGAVLLIACANIANLMLVRADARRQEFAVRAALGAVPARIARELLVESLVLGAGGCVLGLGLAYVGVRVLVAIGPTDLPRLQDIAVYPPVLAFTVAISLVSTLVFGSITALKHALRIDTPMSDAVRGSSASRKRSATRSALVVVQVALALVLAVSAALMIRTFQALRDVDPGFSDSATIQTAGISIPFALVSDPEPVNRVARMTSLRREILDRIAALPGVASVGFVADLPMGQGEWNGPVLVEGEAIAAGHTPPSRRWNFVLPGYFEAMGTRLIAGRDITWSDIEAGGRVAVISEDIAREMAAEPAAALGRRIRLSFDQSGWDEVIGVVQRVHQDGLYEEPPSMVYWPLLTSNRLFGRLDGAFVIRSERAGSASLMNEVRQAVRSVNGTVPVTREGTMQDLYAESLARTSFTLVMLAIAGAMALALGVIGIYGVIAYIVAQRTREIGIRSALGAGQRQLARMFLLHGLALSGVGAAAGFVAALGLGRVMSSLLFGIGPTDPVAYAAALGVTVAAAALASYVPARRAARINPMLTMKVE